MISFVIVTHCAALARAIAEEAHVMAPDVTIVPAGGTADGGVGTDFTLITEAIRTALDASEGSGVIVLMDLGSAVITTALAIEEFEEDNITMADCPVTEGAIAGTVLAEGGAGPEEILAELERTRQQRKL